MDAGLTGIRQLFEGATLTADERHTVDWCLQRLPDLYQKLSNSSESRYADDIRGLVRAMLERAPGLAEEVARQFQSFHERLGLPSLNLKPPTAPAAKRKPRKAG